MNMEKEFSPFHFRFYNLDAILSVGYRVNSVNATAFRRWATSILKQHLLRGYGINQQLMQIEDRINRRLESQHNIFSSMATGIPSSFIAGNSDFKCLMNI